jgi:hypothetical protein
MRLTSENITKKLIGQRISMVINKEDKKGYIKNVDSNSGYFHLNIALDQPHYYGKGYGSTKSLSMVVCPNENAPYELTII